MCSLRQVHSPASKLGTNGSSPRRPLELQRANYETPPRSELRTQQPVVPRKISTLRISQLCLPDGTKRWFDPRQTFALRAYPRLPLKFNTSTNIELMKPIPGTLQEEGASRSGWQK